MRKYKAKNSTKNDKTKMSIKNDKKLINDLQPKNR